MSSATSPSTGFGETAKDFGTEGSTQPTDEGTKEKSSDIIKADKNSSWSSSKLNVISRPRNDDAARQPLFKQKSNGQFSPSASNE